MLNKNTAQVLVLGDLTNSYRESNLYLTVVCLALTTLFLTEFIINICCHITKITSSCQKSFQWSIQLSWKEILQQIMLSTVGVGLNRFIEHHTPRNDYSSILYMIYAASTITGSILFITNFQILLLKETRFAWAS